MLLVLGVVLLVGAVGVVGAQVRRRGRQQDAAERVARASAMMAENGYRGPWPHNVPADPATPPTAEPDGFAHFASKEQLAYSRETGHPVQALCGRTWVPVTDPAGHPVCPRCEAVHKAMPERPLNIRRH